MDDWYDDNDDEFVRRSQSDLEKERNLVAKLKHVQLDELTAHEKKLLERELVAEADLKIAGELFGATIETEESNQNTSTEIKRLLHDIPLKSKHDHVDFANICCYGLKNSPSELTLAYFIEITNHFKSKLTIEHIDNILQHVQALSHHHTDITKVHLLDSLDLTSKEDFIDFAAICAHKLELSTVFNLFAFHKELTDQLRHINGIISYLTSLRDEKKPKVVPNNSNSTSKAKKSVKQMKKHVDSYDSEDDYDGDYY